MTNRTDATHDPERQSWVASANGHADFPVQNLPFGIFSHDGTPPRAGVAIGDEILDLGAIGGILPAPAAAALASPNLNGLLALPGEQRLALRQRLSDLLSDERFRPAVEPHLVPASATTLHLPCEIGDYTDFYVGIHHAMNVGRLFRPDNPLLPNYKHIPIGYHGRASSIRTSGHPVHRPTGQRRAPDATDPVFAPSSRLDFELELGVWIGPGNALGTSIPIAEAADHIAGLCLLNDWSARDFQAWEYQPLGPFLSKNFLTSISPWVVTSEALAPFRVAPEPRPAGDPTPLPYLDALCDQMHGGFAIDLGVTLSTSAMRATGLPEHRISASKASHMYWTAAQMVAHHSAGGCNLRPGDLLGTGTISTPDNSGLGSLLELTQGGAAPLTLPNGETRTFLENGDEIIFTGRAHADGYASIGFGSCIGRING
ncbi:fumarylacetoacetase [Sphingopyxis panaciterrae]